MQCLFASNSTIKRTGVRNFSRGYLSHKKPYKKPWIYLKGRANRMKRPDYCRKIVAYSDLRPGPSVGLLKIDYFQTLDMPFDYRLDLNLLEKNFNEKLKQIEELDPESGEWEHKRRANLVNRYNRAFENLSCPQKRGEHYFKLHGLQYPKEEYLDVNRNYLKIKLDTTRRLKEYRAPSEWKSFHNKNKSLLTNYISLLAQALSDKSWTKAHQCLLHVQIIKRIIQLTEDLARHPEMQPIKPNWFLKPWQRDMEQIQHNLWSQNYKIELPKDWEGPVF